jgi:hypothetical protein
MKTCFTLLFAAIIFVSWTNSNDCRIFDFGSSPESVMKMETAIFMKKESISHNLIGLTFVEHGNTSNYLYTYTFHNAKLNGLKIKKLSATGDNSLINVLSDYRAAYSRYNANCGVKIKEKAKEFGLKSFSVDMNNKKVFVNMIKDSEEYYLVENIIQK